MNDIVSDPIKEIENAFLETLYNLNLEDLNKIANAPNDNLEIFQKTYNVLLNKEDNQLQEILDKITTENNEHAKDNGEYEDDFEEEENEDEEVKVEDEDEEAKLKIINKAIDVVETEISDEKYGHEEFENENPDTETQIKNAALEALRNQIQIMLFYDNINNAATPYIPENYSYSIKEYNYEKNPIFKNYFDEKYKILDPPGDGTCFFYVVEEAFKQLGYNLNTHYLRYLVSKNIDENLFTQYKSFEEEEGYTYMKNIQDTNSFRQYVLQSKWLADDWAISVIEKELKVKFIIFAEKANTEDKIIKCNIKNEEIPYYYILTSYTEDHYRLITYDGKSIFKSSEIPDKIKSSLKDICKEDIR